MRATGRSTTRSPGGFPPPATRRQQGDDRIRIDILIRSLGAGGAERQAAALAAGLLARGVAVRVLTFYPGGVNAEALRQAGVPLLSFGKKGRWDVVRLAAGLAGALVRRRPDVLYTFMPTANILAALAKPLLRGTRIMMGVRVSAMELDRYDRLSRAVYRWEVLLSKMADLVVVNSAAGRAAAIARGFRERRIRVVPNGIDTQRFRPDPVARARLRAAIGVAEEVPVIGMVARADPMKDHETFLQAAAILHLARPDVRFVLAGAGTDDANRLLRSSATRLDLAGCLTLLGERPDIEAVYAAMDICTLSSAFGEAFPNALGEAMACGLPCVATDVGDSAAIVGQTGRIVPARDPAALAGEWSGLLQLSADERRRAGALARRRIEEQFGLARMVEETLALAAPAWRAGAERRAGDGR